MSLKLFITGTDTDAGKTYISVGLLNGLNKYGYVTLGLKPIASGCGLIDGELYNGDALALQKASLSFGFSSSVGCCCLCNSCLS